MNSPFLSRAVLLPLGACVVSFGLQAQGLPPALKLAPGDSHQFQQFGAAVAVDGDIAVAGAPADSAQGIYNAGSAYIFARDPSGWTQVAKLEASDPAEFSQFGYAVAVDGDTLAVGARYDAGNAGAVYVFTRSDTAWTQQAKLVPPDPASAPEFGCAVALDGDTLVAGAPADAEAGFNAGAAYVFIRSGTGWTQQAKLLPGVFAPGDTFGLAVAVSGDTLAVGAPYSDGVGEDAGSIQVFVRSGTSWTHQAALTVPDAGAGVLLGWSVAADGDTILAGAPRTSAGGDSAGAAYLFARTAGTWSLSDRLTAETPAEYELCGYSVGLRGGRAVIGASIAANPPFYQAGAAHLFQRSGKRWTRAGMVRPADNAEGDQFGYCTALSETALLVGAPYQDLGWGFDNGAAYTFDLPPLPNPNQPPVADASATPAEASAASPEGARVVLDGSRSSDPDGDPLTFQWFESGNPIANGSPASVTLPVGPHIITLEVNDGLVTVTTTVTVNVVPVNLPPVAEAGPAGLKIISPNNRNARVTLDGGQSSDPEGEALSFQWLSGEVLLATTPRLELKLPVGTHTLRLRVSDGQASATDKITVRVITAGEATRDLMRTLKEADVPPIREKTLLVLLRAAGGSFDRGQMKHGAVQLRVFQWLVMHREGKPIDSRTARLLVREAQKIVEAMAGR
jgi:hypothetical protein